jgi:hypothetical protein
MFKFQNKGISIGTILVSSIDPSVRALVVDDSHIEVAGRRTSLSSGALELMRSKGSERRSIQGTKFWLFNGTALADLPDVDAQVDARPANKK